MYCATLYCTVLYCTALHCTVLYYTILYYTILYYTILYYTILYCTVLINWNKGKSWAFNSTQEIEHICSQENPAVFAIHEFNLRKTDDLNDMNIQGYKLLLDDMYQVHNMARTALYIRDNVKFIRRNDLEVKGDAIISVTIHPKRSKPLNLVSYYRQWQVLGADAAVPGTLSEKAQKSRMETIAKKCRLAIAERETIFLSDSNIDFSHDYSTPSKLKTHQKKQIPIYRIYKEYLFDNGVSIIKTPPHQNIFQQTKYIYRPLHDH